MAYVNIYRRHIINFDPGIDHRLACEVELSLSLQASRQSMPGTDYVSAINVHVCRTVVLGRSVAYVNQA